MGESRVYPTRLQCYVLLSWLAKDFAWVLLLPPLALPAALLAILLESYSAHLSWKRGTWAERAPTLACIFWLTGSAIWMTSELAFDDEDGIRWFPWQSEPLKPDKELKVAGVRVALFFYATGLACLSLLLLDLGRQRTASSSNPQEEDQNDQADNLVWGFLPPMAYRDLFVAPWILKDMFWASECLTPAMIAAVATALIILDSYRRFGSPLCLTELVWVLANTIWLYGELRDDISAVVREIAAGCLALAAVAALLTLTICVPSKTDKEDSDGEQPSAQERLLTFRKHGYSST